MNPNPCLGAALALVLVVPGDVLAQSSVDSQVQRLEETIRAIEQRVASLEAQLLENSPPARIAPGKVNWRKLKKGMSEREVEQLLGSPSDVDVYTTYTSWKYVYGGSYGRVEFYGNSGKVRGWSEP